MSDSLNIKALVEPLSAEAACGIDMGDKVPVLRGKLELADGTAGYAKRWQDMRDLSVGYFAKGKSLEVVVYLARAELALRGLEGFSEGLELIQGLLEQRWDSVFPALNKDDKRGPAAARFEALTPLAPPAQRYDELDIRGGVGEAILCRSSRGTVQVQNLDGKPLTDEVQAILADLGYAPVKLARDRVEKISKRLEMIAGLLKKHETPAGDAPNFASIRDPLTKAVAILDEKLIGMKPGPDPGPGPDPRPDPVPKPATGKINSSTDAKLWLEKICEYYDKAEPSSPVPIMLRRAIELIGKDFSTAMNLLGLITKPVQIKAVETK